MENNYVTKEDFNDFKEKLKPIIMNVLERLDTIEGKIDKVYSLTQELASKTNTTEALKVQQKTEVITSDLVKYSRDSIKELFSSTDDEFTKNTNFNINLFLGKF